MHPSKQTILYLSGGVLLVTLIVFGALVFSIQEKPFLFQGNVFDSSKYLFAKEKNSLEVVDLSIVEGAFLHSDGPPFLVSGRTLGSLSESPGGKEIREYTVKQGDTLSSIAEDFGISLSTMLWANDLSSRSTISPGDKLLVLPVSGALHVVNKGDTLGRIAGIYEGDIGEIVKINDLESEDDIFVGDLLIIPGGKEPATPSRLAEVPVAASYFIFPAEGKITQGLHGVTGNAVDVANECGNPVVAAAAGKVLRAGPIWIGGNRVTILHSNGVVSYYGHLSSILVYPGQIVKTGDIIGRIGNTGYTLGATGCHLHFELRGARNFLANYSVGSFLKWGN